MLTIKRHENRNTELSTNKLILKGTKAAFSNQLGQVTLLKNHIQKLDTTKADFDKKEHFLFEIY